MNVFCDQARDFGGLVSDDVEESYDVGATSEILQNFDFTLDFLLLHRLEYFDDTSLVIGGVDPLEYLRSNEG